MDNDTLAQARYAGLRWNAPLSESHANDLLKCLKLSSSTSIVDVGCGWGELLLRAALQIGAEAAVTGIDTDAVALARGKLAAEECGLNVSFIEEHAADWRGTSCRALCIGSSHTLGGSKEMFDRLAELVPRGRVLVGDMCWEKPPTKTAQAIFGDEIPMLVDLFSMCRRSGWEVLHMSMADQREWDDFEFGHRAGLRQWLLDNPDSPRAKEVRDEQDAKELEYLTSYRGVLGFVYLVLGR